MVKSSDPVVKIMPLFLSFPWLDMIPCDACLAALSFYFIVKFGNFDVLVDNQILCITTLVL